METNTKNKVITKVKTIFQEFVQKGLTPARPFCSDVIEIVSFGADKIQVEVTCIFCGANGQSRRKKIKVQSEVRANAQYWNYANLRKHIRKCHAINTDVMQSTRNDHQILKLIESLPVVYGEESQAEQSIAKSQAEQMANRFMEQIWSMIQTTAEHSEQEKVMIFKREANNRLGILKVIKMPADGNCLFAACVNQLYRIKSETNQHKELVNNLRHDVCQYINENFSRFNRIIELRLKDEHPNHSIASIHKMRDNFVKQLERSGFWGGTESLIAISELYNANIVVFRENGPYHFATKYDEENKRTLFLAYRNISGKMSHYDSVSHIDNIVLSNCAVDLYHKVSDSSDVITID